jgi:hypothetical protein
LSWAESPPGMPAASSSVGSSAIGKRMGVRIRLRRRMDYRGAR